MLAATVRRHIHNGHSHVSTLCMLASLGQGGAVAGAGTAAAQVALDGALNQLHAGAPPSHRKAQN